ncbi:MAG TPA: acyl-CoA dehydrogenase [Deltaproteobacteria bacterium]|nr:acyl-CoA dehydrogenase [Deltaproteobacteria bacterium]
MAQLISDRRDMDFVLHEQLKVSDLCKHSRFSDLNKKAIDMIITEAGQLAVKEILPTMKIGDEEGVEFNKGTVTIPEAYHRAYRLFREGEWVAMTKDLDWGGQRLPHIIAMASHEFFVGANCSFMIYPGLTQSVGTLIELYGSDDQKNLYLKNLYTGKWCGTMLLTEPQAGSDVGALTTTAAKNPDGTYSISGSKIFISSGEHDLTDNIVHPVLARIEGAPAGTKGISLFLVPKYRVNDDGSLGEFNDVVCTGIEKKMGIHGNATCSLTLGGNGECRGTLLGEENKGMRAMFRMMNEARLLVGLQGFSFATTAYMYAVNYARERVQGKHLLQMRDPDAPSVPIIEHPDIRRILLTMKAYVEGMRSLLYYVSFLTDLILVTDDPEEKATYQGMIDVLIPIAKGYVTDRAFEVCNHGLQIYGGYGYTKDYPMEQLVRDSRITMIYEGTNGIQAMDLLGRKLGLNNGKAVMDLMSEVQKTVAEAKAVPKLDDLAKAVEVAVNKLGETALHMGAKAMSEDILVAFAHAYPFMEISGDVVMAWMLLWRAVIAANALNGGAQKKDKSYYEGQIKSAEFFIHTILPVTIGKMNAVLDSNPAAIEISDVSFGG